MENTHCVRKHVSPVPTTGTGLQEQKRTAVPVILTLPCMGVVALTADMCITGIVYIMTLETFLLTLSLAMVYSKKPEGKGSNIVHVLIRYIQQCHFHST